MTVFSAFPPSCAVPRPADEARRLAAVRSFGLLDTAPEPEFDATVRIAARLFNLPVALIALMDDDRLWFKSRLGVDLPQLDREVAFCAHAIMRPDEVMVVEDLRADPRFAGNPLVTGGPELRFYAGAPLQTPDGLALGTIAVLGPNPRQFSSADCEALRDLSLAVMTAIECRRRADALVEIAKTDFVTGLSNRAAFEAALARWERNAEAGAVLYLDLDRFKAVNDRHGHAAGDSVLSEVGRRLRLAVGEGAVVARLGGDEFGILDTQLRGAEAAHRLARRLIDTVSQPIHVEGLADPVSIGLSAGVALASPGGKHSLVLQQADEALYQAKRARANPIQIFGQSVAPATGPVLKLSPDPETDEGCGACSAGTEQPFPFTMAFQPIINARLGTVFAYEALVRGPAGESAASVLNQVSPENRYAFDQSCRRTAISLSTRLGIVASGARLSINFIPGAMYQPENCVRATLAAARQHGFPLDRLIFEVTEGEQVNRPDHLAEIFRVYRQHGFLPAIDDFGAGYSGLNMLAEFQPAIIKLDRQLIQAIDQSRSRQAIVRGVLAVCADLDISPIAEGVETREEFLMLRDFGIELFQGYLIAHPGFESLPEPVIPT